MNIVECLRQQAVENLFKGTFDASWGIRRELINSLAPRVTEAQIYDLGDHLKEIFEATASNDDEEDRSQSSLSSGGTIWESLVCWYLNLCLIGRRTVVIKAHKKLIPEPIRDAITVNYRTVRSNSESDLVAITFPDQIEFTQDIDNIVVHDENDKVVRVRTRNKTVNFLAILNALCSKYFDELEIHIIQCKTNWNDNAQIPMLWNALYLATGFRRGTEITVGQNGFSIGGIRRFTYAFVTVPTVKLDKFKTDSVAVQRVIHLSGGNYWGVSSRSGIAKSVKEMLDHTLSAGHPNRIRGTLKDGLIRLSTDYAYFRFFKELPVTSD